MKKKHYIPYDKKGDQLEVKLTDESFKKTYQNRVRTNDIKKLANLINDLELKGVPITKAREYLKKAGYKDITFW